MRKMLVHTLPALLFGLVLSVHVTLARQQRHRRHSDNCPSIKELERQLHSPPDYDRTFYQFPPLREKALTLKEFEKKYPKAKVETTITPIHKPSESVCSVAEQHLAGIPLQPCPVQWTLNHDRNRYPETLVEAQCVCQECVGLNRTDEKLKYNNGDPKEGPLGCSEITFYTKVMRKAVGCQYEQVLEPITIGCACTGDTAQKNSRQNDGVHSD